MKLLCATSFGFNQSLQLANIVKRCVTAALFILLFACCKKPSQTNSLQDWKVTDLDYPYELRSISFKDQNNGIVVGGVVNTDSMHSILFRTTDGGNTWAKDTFPVPNFNVAWITASGGDWYMFGIKLDVSRQIYRSVDNGYTWKPVREMYNGLVHFFDQSSGIITDLTKVYRTTDGGQHFNQVYEDAIGFARFNQIQFIGETGYISGGATIDGNSYAMMAKTVNNGVTWSKVAIPDGNLFAFKFLDPLIGYAFVYPDLLYKTTDGTTSWKLLPNRLPVLISGVQFINETEAYITGGHIIYHTLNGGKTWQEVFYAPKGQWLYGMFVVPGTRKLFMLCHDGIIISSPH